jgi:photosystem II stability/assembly factor-like uncharacterized protein
MKITCFKTTALLFCLLLMANFINAQTIVPLQQGKPTSIRGLSVVDDNIAWISGSSGYIALTRDGGKSWNWQQVKGFEKADFRDIEAFSDKEAIIMSSGTPALILKTTDGGANWQVKYRNADTAYFLDALDFPDKKYGFVLGDPINKKFVLLETKDGGETWNMFKNRPDALSGEAAFAASGTCLRVGEGSIDIVTGGTVARCLTIFSPFAKWSYETLPILQGKDSQGAFSIAGPGLVIVGGDYSNDKIKYEVACQLIPRKGAYTSIQQGPSGFQSCVEFINANTYLSTGTPGSNITIDGGKKWSKIDDNSYNVCRKAKRGKLVLLAGDGGKIGILKM